MRYYEYDDVDLDDPHTWDTYGYPGWVLYGDDMYVPDEYMEERWKPIEGFEGYYWISDCARVWSVKRCQFLTPKPMDRSKHLGVMLCVNGREYYRYVHRLVAQAFIPNPNNLPEVRHKYDNIYYNEPEDLEWGTQLDNMHDAIKNGHFHFITHEEREIGLSKMRVPVKAIDLKTGEEIEYRSIIDAARDLGLQTSNIHKVLKGLRVHTRGWYFEYINRGDR